MPDIIRVAHQLTALGYPVLAGQLTALAAMRPEDFPYDEEELS